MSGHDDYLDPDIHLWPPDDGREELETDPYGSLTFAIGTGDDFYCFDYAIDHEHGIVRLHAVINSETGSFIMDAEKPVEIPANEAVAYAEGLVDQALDWCGENDIVHDHKGWNQKPEYFVECVRKAVSK
jgi:hypothetical protein